jgi:hypothetical protein
MFPGTKQRFSLFSLYVKSIGNLDAGTLLVFMFLAMLLNPRRLHFFTRSA